MYTVEMKLNRNIVLTIYLFIKLTEISTLEALCKVEDTDCKISSPRLKPTIKHNLLYNVKDWMQSNPNVLKSNEHIRNINTRLITLNFLKYNKNFKKKIASIFSTNAGKKKLTINRTKRSENIKSHHKLKRVRVLRRHGCRGISNSSTIDENDNVAGTMNESKDQESYEDENDSSYGNPRSAENINEENYEDQTNLNYRRKKENYQQVNDYIPACGCNRNNHQVSKQSDTINRRYQDQHNDDDINNHHKKMEVKRRNQRIDGDEGVTDFRIPRKEIDENYEYRGNKRIGTNVEGNYKRIGYDETHFDSRINHGSKFNRKHNDGIYEISNENYSNRNIKPYKDTISTSNEHGANEGIGQLANSKEKEDNNYKHTEGKMFNSRGRDNRPPSHEENFHKNHEYRRIQDRINHDRHNKEISDQQNFSKRGSNNNHNYEEISHSENEEIHHNQRQISSKNQQESNKNNRERKEQAITINKSTQNSKEADGNIKNSRQNKDIIETPEYTYTNNRKINSQSSNKRQDYIDAHINNHEVKKIAHRGNNDDEITRTMKPGRQTDSNSRKEKEYAHQEIRNKNIGAKTEESYHLNKDEDRYIHSSINHTYESNSNQKDSSDELSNEEQFNKKMKTNKESTGRRNVKHSSDEYNKEIEQTNLNEANDEIYSQSEEIRLQASGGKDKSNSHEENFHRNKERRKIQARQEEEINFNNQTVEAKQGNYNVETSTTKRTRNNERLKETNNSENEEIYYGQRETQNKNSKVTQSNTNNSKQTNSTHKNTNTHNARIDQENNGSDEEIYRNHKGAHEINKNRFEGNKNSHWGSESSNLTESTANQDNLNGCNCNICSKRITFENITHVVIKKHKDDAKKADKEIGFNEQDKQRTEKTETIHENENQSGLNRNKQNVNQIKNIEEEESIAQKRSRRVIDTNTNDQKQNKVEENRKIQIEEAHEKNDQQIKRKYSQDDYEQETEKSNGNIIRYEGGNNQTRKIIDNDDSKNEEYGRKSSKNEKDIEGEYTQSSNEKGTSEITQKRTEEVKHYPPNERLSKNNHEINQNVEEINASNGYKNDGHEYKDADKETTKIIKENHAQKSSSHRKYQTDTSHEINDDISNNLFIHELNKQNTNNNRAKIVDKEKVEKHEEGLIKQNNAGNESGSEELRIVANKKREKFEIEHTRKEQNVQKERTSEIQNESTKKIHVNTNNNRKFEERKESIEEIKRKRERQEEESTGETNTKIQKNNTNGQNYRRPQRNYQNHTRSLENNGENGTRENTNQKHGSQSREYQIRKNTNIQSKNAEEIDKSNVLINKNKSKNLENSEIHENVENQEQRPGNLDRIKGEASLSTKNSDPTNEQTVNTEIVRGSGGSIDVKSSSARVESDITNRDDNIDVNRGQISKHVSETGSYYDRDQHEDNIESVDIKKTPEIIKDLNNNKAEISRSSVEETLNFGKNQIKTKPSITITEKVQNRNGGIQDRIRIEEKINENEGPIEVGNKKEIQVKINERSKQENKVGIQGIAGQRFEYKSQESHRSETNGVSTCPCQKYYYVSDESNANHSEKKSLKESEENINKEEDEESDDVEVNSNIGSKGAYHIRPKFGINLKMIGNKVKEIGTNLRDGMDLIVGKRNASNSKMRKVNRRIETNLNNTEGRRGN